MAKIFQAYIHCQYVTKVFSLLARSSPATAAAAAAAAATVVDLELAAEPAALPAIQDSQNYLACWEKQIVAFCFGSSIEIAVLFAGGPRKLPATFIFLSVALLLAFTCICVGKCYMNYSKFRMIARRMEQVGGFFMVTAFFIAIAIPFPLWLQWCTGAVYAVLWIHIMVCNLF